MIHASQLFPIALDRIHDHLERVNASSGNPETKRKVERKAGGRETARVKRNAHRVGVKQMELPLNK